MFRGCSHLPIGAIVCLAVVLAALAVPTTPVAAQGLFDFLFGGFHRPRPPPVHLNAPSDLLHSLFDDRKPQESVRSSDGPHAAFCVRLCDGRYFPVAAHRNASSAEQCHAACPATATKLFSGGGIDHAVASDGTHYADIANAFVYRKHIVPSCTCNGKTSYSLAEIAIADDPTLRPGDIVATNSGLAVYSGRNRNKQADFTPIGSANVGKAVRSQLADVKITPRHAPAAAATTGQAPASPASSAAR